MERAFGALKNRFKILYNKPFHPYPTQVKLVLACCILHNWILRHGVDEHVPAEDTWEPNHSDETIPNDQTMDNNTWLPREMIGQTKCGPIGGHLGIELLLYHLICMLLVLFTDDSFIYDVMSRCYCLRLLIRAMMNQLYYLPPVI